MPAQATGMHVLRYGFEIHIHVYVCVCMCVSVCIITNRYTDSLWPLRHTILLDDYRLQIITNETKLFRW